MGTPNASAIFATTWTLGFLTESLSILGDHEYGMRDRESAHLHCLSHTNSF